jgi:hypothetical protein
MSSLILLTPKMVDFSEVAHFPSAMDKGLCTKAKLVPCNHALATGTWTSVQVHMSSKCGLHNVAGRISVFVAFVLAYLTFNPVTPFVDRYAAGNGTSMCSIGMGLARHVATTLRQLELEGANSLWTLTVETSG